jgi:hypothetical protein
MLRLILSAIVGAAAAYYWRDAISKYANDAIPGMRNKVADRFEDIGNRADEAFDSAKSRIASTVGAAQDKLRATGTSGPGPAETARSTSGLMSGT